MVSGFCCLWAYDKIDHCGRGHVAGQSCSPYSIQEAKTEGGGARVSTDPSKGMLSPTNSLTSSHYIPPPKGPVTFFALFIAFSLLFYSSVIVTAAKS